jgi:hypothetical protein
MNKKQFQKFLDRDKGCWHCGSTGEDLVPQHRSNRGMGGGGSDSPSNIIVLCAVANGLLESDPEFAAVGRSNGWKLSRWGDSLSEPVFDAHRGVWAVLDDSFGRWDTHNFK